MTYSVMLISLPTAGYNNVFINFLLSLITKTTCIQNIFL